MSDAMIGCWDAKYTYVSWRPITASFSAALDEVKDARVFGGIHFRTACRVGQALGESVGEYVLKHSLRPLDGWGQCKR